MSTSERFSISSVDILTDHADQLSMDDKNEQIDFAIIPKMPPADRQGKTKLPITTNIYPIRVRSLIVHRYEVHINASYVAGNNNENFTKISQKEISKGPRDDGSKIARIEACIAAMKIALEMYGLLKGQGQAAFYDGANLFYSNISLDEQLKELNGCLVIKIEHLPEEIRKLMPKTSSELTIEISKNPEIVSEVNISDYNSAKIHEGNLSNIDNSTRQLLDILTTAPFQLSHKWTAYGSGLLFPKDGERKDILVRERNQLKQTGQETLEGISKGIAFIELNNCEMNAALVLNTKTGQFFKEQSLLETFCQLMNWNGIRPFPFRSDDAKRLNFYVKGLRLTLINNGEWSGLASCLTEKPIAEIWKEDERAGKPVLRMEIPEKFSRWPAVEFRSQSKKITTKIYYPVHLLQIAPNQRVPLNKQLGNPPRPPGPNDRFQTIYKRRNGFLAQSEFSDFLSYFGVSVDKNPLKIEGIQRALPRLTGQGGKKIAINPVNASFNLSHERYVQAARLTDVLLAFNCRKEIAEKLKNKLAIELRFKGIEANWHLYDTGRNGDDKTKVQFSFEEAKKLLRKDKLVLLMYLDHKGTDSHGYLKFYERYYLITSQHVTVQIAEDINKAALNIVNKMNTKLGGVNYHIVPDDFSKDEWISNGKTLIIGYDVNHPTGNSRPDEMDTSVSTVGYSFNGAADPEYFIGGFHYQRPLKEQVQNSVLEEIIRDCVTTFREQRKHLPENIVILRDGVSDGQFKMVVCEEYVAIRDGLNNFIEEQNITGWDPKFVLAIVTKRHDKRFFIDTPREVRNPQPGTVVDKEVVRSDLTHFYLQSHRSIIGTAKLPSYYVFVNDLMESDNEALDKLQSFFLALSFEHQISPGSVSLPEPLYQADAWASRGKLLWDTYLKLGLEMPRRNKYNKNMFNSPPCDFSEMTKKLSYRGTSLELHRVNA